jgi:ABC-type nitrate/sulfonate/bicarbonate transport system ATPase subunit
VADTIYVLSHRPATILHRMALPQWPDRGLDLKQSREFRDIENELLDLLHGQEGGLVIG